MYNGFELGDLVFADDHHQHGFLVARVAAVGAPAGDAPVHASHQLDLQGLHHFHLRDDQRLDVDVLDVDPVAHQVADDRVGQGVDHRGDVKEHEAQAVEHQIGGDVDAPPVGVLVHRRCAVPSQQCLLLLVEGHLHGVLAHGVPLPDGYGGVVVVGADEDEYGVEVIAVLRLQFLRLVGDVVPLPAADGIDVWLDAEPVLQPVPPLALRTAVARVCDAVSEICHPFPLPGMLYECLCSCL